MVFKAPPVFPTLFNTGGDQVELFQNGKSLSTQPCGKDVGFEAHFDTVYEPGELLAFGSETALHNCGYEKDETNLTDGCALAILKRTGNGNITASFQCGKCSSD